MKMMTVREFRANTAAIWKDLERHQDLVLTNNGKPIALVTPVTEDSLEDELRMAIGPRGRCGLCVNMPNRPAWTR
jgi:antitoxin (DNA-binding transcriptional repressor) of toxin-antitoxin stability system